MIICKSNIFVNNSCEVFNNVINNLTSMEIITISQHLYENDLKEENQDRKKEHWFL